MNMNNEEITKQVNEYMMPKKENFAKNETIIIAPHPDDEIIGCYEVLMDKEINPIILYCFNVDEKRKEEAMKLRDFVNVKLQMFVHNIPAHLIDPTNKYYFPHPVYETHPAHREKGNIGEAFLRSGIDVTFYSTEMNYHAKYECRDPQGKLDLLNKVYPSQKTLWEYENKYWLFSCYEKWIIK